jgi:metal-dependent amidase/aminoacylase/carboxypeptidase family protein
MLPGGDTPAQAVRAQCADDFKRPTPRPPRRPGRGPVGGLLQAKPGAYVFISNGDGAHREMGHGGGPCTLHNPSYDFNDDLIPLGGTYWVELATQWLAQAPQS